jgi:C1q domain
VKLKSHNQIFKPNFKKMKKIIILLSILVSTNLFAQVPQGINYQSVVRGTNGNPLANQSVTLQFNYVDKSDESIDYMESFVTSTDEFGVVNFVLGTGTEIINSFPELDWSKQFRIDIFVNLGSGFVILGSQDLVSVPYALNAAHAESVDLSLNELTDVNTAGAANGQVLMYDGAEWVPSDVTGGSFGLPYLANDPNLLSFGITNTSALGGTAIYGQTTTNAANATGVKGQATGASGRGVYGTATGATAYGVLGENTTGTAIKGTTDGAGANGVLGVATSATGVGVRGESNDGTGVIAYSGNGLAVNASSLSGDAINANSLSGYALTTSGKVKIAGGNTNPGAGKVLTSDAQGNATWQAPTASPKVAFMANNPTAAALFNSGLETPLALDSEVFDIGNNYDPATDRFTAPVSGIYHFNTSSTIFISSSTDNIVNAAISVVVLRNGSEFIAASSTSIQESSLSTSQVAFSMGADLNLVAGDQVYISIFQFNYGDNPAEYGMLSNSSHYFCGHLVFQN